MKTLTESQFNNYPLIWMYHSRTINRKMNHLNERALRVVYSYFKSSFKGLFMKYNSFSINDRDIESVVIEMYKLLNGLTPVF